MELSEQIHGSLGFVICSWGGWLLSVVALAIYENGWACEKGGNAKLHFELGFLFTII